MMEISRETAEKIEGSDFIILPDEIDEDFNYASLSKRSDVEKKGKDKYGRFWITDDNFFLHFWKDKEDMDEVLLGELQEQGPDTSFDILKKGKVAKLDDEVL